MFERLFLHGIKKRSARSLMLAMVLLGCSLLISPLHARAEACNEIDNNITTIAAGAYHTVDLKQDGTVVAVGDNRVSQLNVSG